MFTDLLGDTMEVNIDGMLVNSLIVELHLDHLRQAFEVLKRYNMKLNPIKCLVGMASSKFLSYMVTQQGIEANLYHIQSMMGIP